MYKYIYVCVCVLYNIVSIYNIYISCCRGIYALYKPATRRDIILRIHIASKLAGLYHRYILLRDSYLKIRTNK